MVIVLVVYQPFYNGVQQGNAIGLTNFSTGLNGVSSLNYANGTLALTNTAGPSFIDVDTNLNTVRSGNETAATITATVGFVGNGSGLTGLLAGLPIPWFAGTNAVSGSLTDMSLFLSNNVTMTVPLVLNTNGSAKVNLATNSTSAGPIGVTIGGILTNLINSPESPQAAFYYQRVPLGIPTYSTPQSDSVPP
jgi:hypothetical protein